METAVVALAEAWGAEKSSAAAVAARSAPAGVRCAMVVGGEVACAGPRVVAA